VSKRVAAIGGIAGPAAFIGAWATLGARAENYAPTQDPISRLAAVGAPTRAEMTGGFIAFAVGVSLYALSARDRLSPRVASFALANAAATLGVAAVPLEGFGGSTAHAAAAGSAYAALAALPAAGATALDERGHRAAARASRVTAVLVGAALLWSVVGPTRHGLFQRLGLTLGDVWIAATAVWILRGYAGAEGRGESPAAR
jgi:hypothetical protein